MAETSILTTTKRTLGLAEDYEVFDQEIIVHINSALGTLNQVGVGPEDGFMIEDKDATWEEFLGTDPRLNSAKSYIYVCVRLLFDSSSMTGPLLNSYEKMKLEWEWRLQVATDPPIPNLPIDEDDDGVLVLDGGTP